MTRGRSLLRGVLDAGLALLLALWLGAIVAAGVAATAVFTGLPRADIDMPAFRAYVDEVVAPQAVASADSPSPRAREFGRIAGGMVMDPVFRWSDRVQGVLAALALITLVAAFVLRRERSRIQRTLYGVCALAIIVAGLLVGWQLAIMGPRMETALHGWWQAARAGDVGAGARAHELRAAFDADHVTANRLYTARLVAVACAVALVGAACGCGARRSTSPERAAA